MRLKLMNWGRPPPSPYGHCPLFCPFFLHDGFPKNGPPPVFFNKKYFLRRAYICDAIDLGDAGSVTSCHKTILTQHPDQAIVGQNNKNRKMKR